METEQILSPSLDKLESTITESRSANDLVVIFAECSVEWAGGREGEIGRGERVVLCKPDGSIAVHRPSGARAVARQSIKSRVELHQLPDCMLLYAQKSKGQNSLRAHLYEVPLCVRTPATDEASVEEYQTEEKMHRFIESNPDAIEDGLRILQHEKPVPQGKIDFVAADADGHTVIIEVKQPAGKATHVDQLLRYVKYYRRTEDTDVRGMLIAPVIGETASRILRDNDLEGLEISEFENWDTSPAQTSFEKWL